MLGFFVNGALSGNNITLNANNNINAAGVNIQADNSISGTAKDINIQNVNNTDTSVELTAVFLILPSKSSVEV
jgi:hypothetical protein